jgi:hypothetical protein
VKLASLPTARDHHAIGVVNGKLYAIGGRINGRHDKNITENEEYDPATDRWRARAPMPTLRSGIVAASLNGKVFVFGGESNSGTHNQTESYDPVLNRWQSWALCPPLVMDWVHVLVNPFTLFPAGPNLDATFSSITRFSHRKLITAQPSNVHASAPG